MSREAFESYQQALDLQHQRNEARHIRTRVHEARQAPHLAGLRWPFELLQNALDAGPRLGRPAVRVLLQHEEGVAVFEHDGAPFSPGELAALLSGGSSKEFGSEETAGRFGTGFLVTHVLAERTSLEGLLSVNAGYELFRLSLDRSGDEDAILENIQRCNEAIVQAEQVPSADSVPSARFEYPIEDDSALVMGIDAVRSALPFLYGTRPGLGEVRLLDSAGTTETWVPEESTRTELEEAHVEDRLIRVRTEREARSYRILRVALREDPIAAALLLLELVDDQWHVRPPAPSEPRIYSQYPLRGSSFVPIGFVFDGRFEPDQERSRALMNEADREALSEAFRAAAIASSYASTQLWPNAHLLARVAPSTSSFDSDDPGEASWWEAQLRLFAGKLADLPIVQTGVGYLPARSSRDRFADFVVPRLVDASSIDETSVDRMWPLVDKATELFPPIQELALDWSETAAGWSALGQELNLVTAQVLARFARGDATNITDLRVDGDPHEWLARFIDVVGECWERRSGVETTVLGGLLPNQKGHLCSASDLRRDAGVPEELKDICEAVGLDVRSGLLSTQLAELVGNRSLSYAKEALATVIPTTAQAEDIVDEFLEHLRALLPEEAECSDANEYAQRGSVRFLDYLWKTSGDDAATVAHQVPLINRTKRVLQWSSERVMMAPVSVWNEAAREFSDAYPSDRVLDDIYVQSDHSIIMALSAWGMAHPDPIIKSAPRELEGRRLAAMVVGDFDSDGVVVRGEEFSQIALLPREVLNHVQEVEQARALLGLVLCHVAQNDAAWRERRTVKGSKAREAIDVPVRGALWLGDLRSRAWVPVRGEDEKPAKAVADASTLRSLLEPTWLEGNDAAIALLTECFDFDELDLRLLGIAPEVQDRVRSGLARLLESGGADPDLYESLAQEVQARQRRGRDVERCRRIGFAVQDAIKEALESYGLTVELVDRGFDYEVTLPTANEILEDAAARFEVGPYFVEVKATASGPARLTPTQAETAASRKSRYVLCVVDLRDLDDERLDADWTGADVEPLASMLGDIGERVFDTCVLVRRARESAVGIRNEAALRYEVPARAWEAGVSISEWVAAISRDPAGLMET